MANETHKENLKITNFAGINCLDINLANLTVLLGPQAVGKSLVLKIIYFFRDLRIPILRFCANMDLKQEKAELDNCKLANYLADIFVKLFPLEFYQTNCNESTSISYRFSYSGNSYELTVKLEGEDKFSLEANGLFKEINRCFYEAKEELDAYESSDIPDRRELRLGSANKKNRFLSVLNEKLNTILPDEGNVFIPAGRAFFSIVDKSLWSAMPSKLDVLDKELLRLDPVFNDFGKLYDSFKEDFEANRLDSDLIKKTLHGVYVRESDHDYIQQSDGRRIELHLASSGQQELIPLAVILESLCSSPPSRPISIYIEEPEAHLFPDAQKETVNAIAKVLNLLMGSGGVKVFLSSHSPYVMTSFNNLLQAGKIIEDYPNKSDAVNKIIPRDTVLKPGAAAAYLLNEKSESRSIMTEGGLINAKDIDSVSYAIMEEFDSLLEL